MPTLQSSFVNFTINSTWTGTAVWNPVTGTYDDVSYSNSTTVTQNKTYSLAGLPADAIISSATLTSTLNSPYTGVALRRVDDVSFSGTKDVLSKIQSLAGDYSSGVTFAYKFKANGGTGGLGSHSSSSTFSDNLLTIVYTRPASTFTLDKMSLDAGQDITCTITPADVAYSHRVTWYLNNTYKQVNNVAAGSTTDVFTVPMDWCKAIPSSTSITCSCTVETLSGSTVTGSLSDNFTMTVPASVVPTLTSLTGVGADLYWDLYVKGYSSVALTINGATGAYDSTIVSYRITGMGFTGTTNPYTTGVLTTAGTNTFYATVTDSRGRTSAQASTTLTVTDYAIPNITAMSADRCDSGGTLDEDGTYGKFVLTYTWSNIGSNALHTEVACWDDVEEEYVLLDNTLIASGGNWVVNGPPFSVEGKYDIRFTIYDSFTSGSPLYRYSQLLAGACLMDINPALNAICVGAVATTEDAFEVAPTMEIIYKDETLDERFEPAGDYVNKSGDTMSGVLTLSTLVKMSSRGAPTADIATQFRTDIFGTTAYDNMVRNFRTDTAGIPYTSRYSAGLAWSTYDTHGFIIPNYSASSKSVYIGAGNANAVNWAEQLYHTGNVVALEDGGTGAQTVAGVRNVLGVGLQNSSTSQQSGFSSDTYLSGSFIVFPSTPAVGTRYKLVFDVTKTAAGTATPIITIRTGTAGSTADTSRCALTFGEGTTAADTGIFEVICVFRTVGSSKSAVIQSIARLTSNLTTTGISKAKKAVVVTSSGFDSTTASLGIGASYNGGTSAAHTIELVSAELIM